MFLSTKTQIIAIFKLAASGCISTYHDSNISPNTQNDSFLPPFQPPWQGILLNDTIINFLWSKSLIKFGNSWN
jgi:hypothetical protein